MVAELKALERIELLSSSGNCTIRGKLARPPRDINAGFNLPEAGIFRFSISSWPILWLEAFAPKLLNRSPM
ncbi:MAG: hypothetical protein IT579_11580 [Verrucomicrobia subdivision 3 bacterium]|nr:hypothetical protein [Limisphaerales bacterium]